MNKLIVSMAAAAALAAGGAAFAQDGGAEAQAGSAWRNNNQNSGYVVPNGYAVPQSAPNTRPDQGPRTAQEYEGNSGWTPPAYSYSGVDAWGRPIYNAVPNAAPVYPRHSYGDRSVRAERGERHYITRNARPHDRDGDGVPNNRDRYPDDSRRW